MRSSPAPAAMLCACFLLMLASSAWADSGSTTASVGKDVVIPAAPKAKKAEQPAAKSAGASSSMGRRAGPAARPQLRQELPGILNPDLLPNCVPGDGVICSDRDYTGLLDAQPTNIVGLDDNYAFGGVVPSLELFGGEETTVDLAQGEFETALKVGGTGEVKTVIGNDVITEGLETETTLAGAALDTRPGVLWPVQLGLTLGSTETNGALEWRTNKPNFYYVLGQNLGFPLGLNTAEDGVFGKK